MDVRCEKCQTEYELDEARLKPGGVTVKCTNCGHMFKIRKRSPTNAGVTPSPDEGRLRPPSARSTPQGGAPEDERQWLIRLENGEQKSCRELATLQQWIIANIVTRESLISRTGKTWKRLGDIAELAQYFDIADEARTTRATKPTGPTGAGKSALAGTMLGIGGTPKAAGSMIADEDEVIDTRTTGNFTRTATGSPQPAKIPQGAKTPPMGSGTSSVLAAAAAATPPPASLATTVPARKPPTGPPPAPRKEPTTPPSAAPSLKGPPPADGRSTAAWVKDPVKQTESSGKSGPSGPFGGKVSAIPDEPAFAGRVRAIPSDEASFETGKVRIVADEDDDDLLPQRRGGRMGIAILLMVLLVGGGAAAAVYFLVIKKDAPAAQAPGDAMQVAAADAAAVVSPIVVDAAAEQSPHEVARAELPTDDETRLRTAMASLAPIDEPPANAVRALLISAIAQSLTDRAGLVDNKGEADKLRKEATSLLIEAATAAQKAQKALPDDPSANLAMAEVLRLQGKPAASFKQYGSTAKARATRTDWARDVALHEAHVLRREAGKGTPAKLAEALAAFTAIDSGDGALEKSADVRARVQRALILLAQNKTAEAKPLVEQVLAAQQDHAAAKALGGKLDTLVAKDDPLPPEDNKGNGSATRPPDSGGGGGGGDSYDSLIDRANKVADTSCTKAMEIYSKALEVKPTGIEALTGLGYCHMDAKQFASAHSRFRSALAISPRYEPALLGVAEAYQQQGLRDEAIAAYRATLEAHPNSAKAKRQLDRLTGGGAGGSTGGGEGSGAQPPPDPNGGSATPPTPTPAPAGSGSAG